jgi:hypothetical protein
MVKKILFLSCISLITAPMKSMKNMLDSKSAPKQTYYKFYSEALSSQRPLCNYRKSVVTAYNAKDDSKLGDAAFNNFSNHLELTITSEGEKFAQKDVAEYLLKKILKKARNDGITLLAYRFTYYHANPMPHQIKTCELCKKFGAEFTLVDNHLGERIAHFNPFNQTSK